MNVIEIKHVVEKCEQIEEFIREQDKWGTCQISTGRDGSTIKPLCSILSRDIWPDFRELLVAKYNELAASVNADKFFNLNAQNSDDE